MTAIRTTKRRGDSRGDRVRRFVAKVKVCEFCTDKIQIDYKDIAKLRRYVSDRGKIEPRRRTGACAKHQRRIALAIKRARCLALLPDAPSHFITREGRMMEHRGNSEIREARVSEAKANTEIKEEQARASEPKANGEIKDAEKDIPTQN
jgi:small subunit ribosomal protein S18